MARLETTEEGEEKVPDPVYVPGDLSPENLKLLKEALNLSNLEIYNRAADELEDWLVDWGSENGLDARQMRGVLKSNEGMLAEKVNEWIAEGERIQGMSQRFEDWYVNYDAPSWFENEHSREWMSGNPDGQTDTVMRLWGELEKIYSGLGPPPGRRITRPTGTGGRTRMTAAEVRQQFDTVAMAGSVNDIWRLLLLESHPNAKQVASEYVEAMVATRGEQALDFETFVREKAKKTVRYKSIYRKKPDSHSEEQFLQPYFQAAQQRLRPRNAAARAIGGAQFGADAGTFQARLDRSNEAITSAPFIQGLGARVESLKGLLKG